MDDDELTEEEMLRWDATPPEGRMDLLCEISRERWIARGVDVDALVGSCRRVARLIRPGSEDVITIVK